MAMWKKKAVCYLYATLFGITEEMAKSLKSLHLSSKALPIKKTFGLNWNEHISENLIQLKELKILRCY